LTRDIIECLISLKITNDSHCQNHYFSNCSVENNITIEITSIKLKNIGIKENRTRDTAIYECRGERDRYFERLICQDIIDLFTRRVIVSECRNKKCVKMSPFLHKANCTRSLSRVATSRYENSTCSNYYVFKIECSCWQGYVGACFPGDATGPICTVVSPRSQPSNCCIKTVRNSENTTYFFEFRKYQDQCNLTHSE
ncbi:hypothetical protein L9F63_022086, partial [Diploptera punctata]